MNSATGTKKTVGFGKALVVFICVFALILCGINVLGTSAHIPLVIATIVATIAGVSSGFTWDEMEKGMSETIKASAPAILIMLIIGMVVGTWMLGGIIPTMIYYGLTWLSPKIFLFAACALCIMVSTFTGSSWTTMGTVGVALVGVGTALQVPLGMTVGAITCGAFFGDKQSPISDYAVFAAGVAKTDIYRHSRYMLYTSGPSLLVSIIAFFLLGLRFDSSNADLTKVNMIIAGLAEQFTFNLWLLVPLIVLAIAIAMKMPASHSLIVSAFSAVVIAVAVQGQSLSSVLSMLYSGFSISSGNEVVDSICNRGGMVSMTYNMTMLICSLSLGGVLTRTHVLAMIVNKLARLIRSRLSLIVSTFTASTIMSFFTGDPFIGGVIPCNALGDKYEELDVDRAVLSRTISDAACVQQPIVPWGVSGVFVAQCFGVPVSQFFLYYFIGFLTPLFGLICAITGIGCPRSSAHKASEATE